VTLVGRPQAAHTFEFTIEIEHMHSHGSLVQFGREERGSTHQEGPSPGNTMVLWCGIDGPVGGRNEEGKNKSHIKMYLSTVVTAGSTVKLLAS